MKCNTSVYLNGKFVLCDTHIQDYNESNKYMTHTWLSRKVGNLCSKDPVIRGWTRRPLLTYTVSHSTEIHVCKAHVMHYIFLLQRKSCSVKNFSAPPKHTQRVKVDHVSATCDFSFTNLSHNSFNFFSFLFRNETSYICGPITVHFSDRCCTWPSDKKQAGKIYEARQQTGSKLLLGNWSFRLKCMTVAH